MKKRLVTALLAGMIAAFAMVTGGIPAQANYWEEAVTPASDQRIAPAWDHVLWTTDNNPGGRLRYDRNGQKVEVCDRQADGWRAVGYVWDTVTGERVHTINVPANENCKTRDRTDRRLVQGRLHAFRICLDRDDPSRDDDRFCNAEYWRA
jgi:hypothetical protein